METQRYLTYCSTLFLTIWKTEYNRQQDFVSRPVAPVCPTLNAAFRFSQDRFCLFNDKLDLILTMFLVQDLFSPSTLLESVA